MNTTQTTPTTTPDATFYHRDIPLKVKSAEQLTHIANCALRHTCGVESFKVEMNGRNLKVWFKDRVDHAEMTARIRVFFLGMIAG